MQTLEEQAQRYASKAHAEAGQRRKYTDEPYICLLYTSPSPRDA